VSVAVVSWFGLAAAGFRSLIVMSGSMRPAIGVGDVVLVKTVPADQAQVGDVVSFRDPSRSQELVTHRVVAIQAHGDQLAFVTKGDQNTGTENWTIGKSGTIGRLSLHIPAAGIVLVWLGRPNVRAALVIASLIALGAVAIRLILGLVGQALSPSALLARARGRGPSVGARAMPARRSVKPSSTRTRATRSKRPARSAPGRQ
jgi:signal peptidase